MNTRETQSALQTLHLPPTPWSSVQEAAAYPVPDQFQDPEAGATGNVKPAGSHTTPGCMQGIVVYLVKMLDRTNMELLILATAFLKKLSIYQENKDQMAACDVVSRLVSLMATDNEVLLLATLRLLHNLSFDSGLQDEMIKQGLLPKVGHSAYLLLHCLHIVYTCLHIVYTLSTPVYTCQCWLPGMGKRVWINLREVCTLANNSR